jgi:hypothetical protein
MNDQQESILVHKHWSQEHMENEKNAVACKQPSQPGNNTDGCGWILYSAILWAENLLVDATACKLPVACCTHNKST